METPFFGGTYHSLSTNLADDRCMNLIPEVIETKQGKKIGGFYSTPGQRKLLTLSNSGSGAVGGPLRGVRSCSNNKLVAVFGNQVVQIDINNNVVALGHLNTSSGPVSIIDNGKQYAVFDGFLGYSYSSGTWSPITTLPNFPGVATIQDGFGLVSILNTNKFYQSNLNDLTTWNDLNFSSADSEPSNIQGITSLFRQLWVIKQKSIEVWNNAGLNGFVFQRMQGAFINVGCSAPYSIASNEDHIFWMGTSNEGSLSVYTNNGYSESRISTYPIEYQISSYLSKSSIGIADAIGFCYTQNGHVYYVLTFPSGDATWVYDLTTGFWHERGEYLNGTYHRWDPSCYAFFNKQHIVGSSTSQQLSILDYLYPTDDLAASPPSNPKRWSRTWPAIAKSPNAPFRFESLKIDMQTGLGLGGFYPGQADIKVTGKLPNYLAGNAISYTYTASGTFPSYTFSIASGSLPPGLSISSYGVVSGTPTTAGQYQWTVSATDKFGNVGVLEDGNIITAYTYWLTGSDNNVFVSNSITSWTSASEYQRSPYVNLDNTPLIGGYIQTSSNIVGLQASSVTGVSVEIISNLIPSGTIAAVVKVLDSSNHSYRLRYYNGILIVALNNSSIFYASSDNGNTWNSYSCPGGFQMFDIAYFNAKWVCESSYGSSGGFYYSNDAGIPTNWVLASSALSSDPSSCMCVTKNKVFKVGSNGRIFSSSDGVNWSSSADLVYPGGLSAYNFAYDGTNILISNGGGNTVYKSSNDGASFTTAFTSSFEIANLRYFNGYFMVSDTNSAISISSDGGTTWSTVTQPTGATSITGSRTLSAVLI